MSSEPIPAQITIGGALTKQSRLDLATAIEWSGVSLEYGGDSFDRRQALNAIDQAIDLEEFVTLYDDEANHGQFPQIEKACAVASLPFSRSCEAKYEYDGEVVYFDGKVEHFAKADQGGDPVIPLADLKKAKEKGTIDELIAQNELAASSPPPLTRTSEFEAENQAEIARFRAAVLAENPEAVEDDCLAGISAFGGYCFDLACVCGGVPHALRATAGAV